MAKQILVGGLNASKREAVVKESNTKQTKKPKKAKTKKQEAEIVEASVENTNIQKELDKMDNLPDNTPTEASVTEDGKVQIDLSSVFGPGTFAELEGEDAKNFLKEQAAGNNPTASLVEDLKSNQNEVSNQILEEHENVENNEGESTPSEDDISPEIMAAGNPNCYAYLSLKATGVYNPDIISFGLVTEDGKAFYAEMKDVNIMKITPNVLVNVIQRRFNLQQDDITDGRVCVVGDANYIRTHLLNWIKQEFTDKGLVMQVVSDRVVNEFGLFMELLLNGIPLEEYARVISPVCIDLNTVLAGTIDIAKPKDVDKDEFLKGYIPAYIATDINRLDITGDETPIEYLGNALVNAQAIRAAFRRLDGLDKDEDHVDLIKKKE